MTKTTKNSLAVVAKVHDEGEFMNFPKPKQEILPIPKTPEPMIIRMNSRRELDTTQSKIDVSLLGKVRGVKGDGRRDKLNQAWYEIKHSKLANQKLDVFLRQAKVKGNSQTSRKIESIEDQVSKTL